MNGDGARRTVRPIYASKQFSVLVVTGKTRVDSARKLVRVVVADN
jgi:hypothetical protein